jgi:cytidylate kinase
LPEVREKLVRSRRNWGKVKSVVMDGRDIGTNVRTSIPSTNIFYDRLLSERAHRRWLELEGEERIGGFETGEEDIIRRDHQ